MNPAQKLPAGPGRSLVCAVLAVLSTVVALGAAFDLWLNSVSFGGPDDTSVGVGSIAVHVAIIVLAAVIPLAVARILLGRIPPTAVILVLVATILLCIGVLGVAL